MHEADAVWLRGASDGAAMYALSPGSVSQSYTRCRARS